MRSEHDPDEESAWDYGDEDVRINITALMEMWQMYRKGVLPNEGGLLDQPLSQLVSIEAIDLVVNTISYLESDKADFNKLSKTQMELVSWLNK